MAYKIEKGLPLPDQPARFPFADMEVGDCFLVTDVNTRSVRVAATMAHRTHPSKRWTVRALPEGTRVWRTK